MTLQRGKGSGGGLPILLNAVSMSQFNGIWKTKHGWNGLPLGTINAIIKRCIKNEVTHPTRLPRRRDREFFSCGL